MAMAMRGWAVWKPNATRVMRRILVLVDSMSPLERLCLIAARIRSRCLTMVLDSAACLSKLTSSRVQIPSSVLVLLV